MHTRLAYSILFGVLLLTILALGQFSIISFDYNFENFFPKDHPELDYYLQYRETFENDNDYLLIALKPREGIFQSSFLKEVHRLSQAMKELPHVEEVISLTEVKQPIIGPLGLTQVPLLRWDEPEKLAIDSMKLASAETPPAYFIARNGDALAVLLKNKQQIGKEEGDELSEALFHLLEESSIPEFHVAGKAYAQGAFVNAMQGDLGFYLGISGLFVVVLLWLSYRQWFGVVLPLAVVGLSVVWLIGFMAATGKALDILSVILPNVMFVIGMSDVVHLFTKYLEELRDGHRKETAIKNAYKEVGRATFLTSVTTSIGFLSLALSNIQPIRELGLYTAAGVWMAFLLAFTLMPALLYLLPIPEIAKYRPLTQWPGIMQACFRFSLRHRMKILLGSLGLILISLVGIGQLNISTYLIDDIPESSPLKQAFTYFDEHFGGSKPFEMSLKAGDGYDIYDPAVLAELGKLEDYLIHEFGLAAIVSPLQVAKGLQMASAGGRPENYRLPESEGEWRALARNLNRVKGNTMGFWGQSERADYARLTARMPDMGSALALEKTEALRKWVQRKIPSDVVQVRVTGTSYLIDLNNELLALSTLQGLGVALLAICIVSALLFRSWRMALLAILPNLLPIALVAGIMGFVGIPLKLSTAIIFAISFGIVVDDSIHFLSKLHIELGKGKPLAFALSRTFLSAGKAIVLTSLMLMAGFVSLMFSSFSGIFAIGLLVSLTLLFAVVLDLSLLPALLSLVGRRLDKKK